jgi:hypothetical protein
MALDPIIAEAYARVRRGREHLIGLKVMHPGLLEPLRFITKVLDTVNLKETVGGVAHPWLATAFTLKLPEQSVKDGLGEGELIVDGVSSRLRPHIETMAASGHPAEVDYYEWEVTHVSGAPDFSGIAGPIQFFKGLLLKNVDLGSTQAKGVLAVRDYGFTNFPREKFDATRFPALHGG